MTALDDYAKLEAEGRYHDGASSTASSVAVSFGKRSLVICDFSDNVLAHWPLASLKIEEEAEGASVKPDSASAERVVLQDDEMVAAIRKICGEVQAAPSPAPTRRRFGWRGWVVVAAVIGALAWMAPSHTGRLAGYLPPDRAGALGEAMAAHIVASAGPDGSAFRVCEAAEGLAALDRLVARLLPTEPLPYALRLRVLDSATIDGVALPGGQVLLFRGVLDRAQTPEEVAAVLAHLIGHVAHGDPERLALSAAGAQAIFGLAMGDLLREGVVIPASEASLRSQTDVEAERAADARAHGLLAQAGLPSLAYANFVNRVQDEGGLALHPDPGGRARAAADADQIGASAFAPALDDRNWIALQNICDP